MERKSKWVKVIDVVTRREQFTFIAGRGWFKNIQQNHPGLRIASKTEAIEHRRTQMSHKDWVIERSHFINTYSQDTVFPSKKHIFLIEVGTIRDATNQSIALDVLV